MKKCFLLLGFALLINLGYSQTTNTEKIIQFLGQEKYEDAAINNPGLIIYLEAKLQYGYKVVDFNPTRMPNYSILLEVPSKIYGNVSVDEFLVHYEMDSFNFLNYQYPCKEDENLYFKLGNTGKAIIIYSNEFVNSNSRY